MASHSRTATYQDYGFVQLISVDTPLSSPGKWVLYLSSRVIITIRGETVCTPVHMHLCVRVYDSSVC